MHPDLLEEALEQRWNELETLFQERRLNFHLEEMEAYATVEDFLSSRPTGEALRLVMRGY